MSLKTVDNHRTNLMQKLDVHSVAELLSYALREGLLDSSAQLCQPRTSTVYRLFFQSLTGAQVIARAPVNGR